MKTPNGHCKLTVYLRMDQYLWLGALALEGVAERGGGRPDSSELIRAFIDKLQPEIDALRESKKPKKRRRK